MRLLPMMKVSLNSWRHLDRPVMPLLLCILPECLNLLHWMLRQWPLLPLLLLLLLLQLLQLHLLLLFKLLLLQLLLSQQLLLLLQMLLLQLLQLLLPNNCSLLLCEKIRRWWLRRKIRSLQHSLLLKLRCRQMRRSGLL